MAASWSVPRRTPRPRESLELESGIKSTTLHTAWRQAARDQKRLRRAGSIEGAKILANYEKQVWVIDEATQVDAAMMRKLATAAEKLHFRVVLVGDPQQLGAIGAGKPFELMLRDADMRHVEMDQIQRQRDPEHLKAVRSAIAGDVTQAITALAPDTAEIANKDQRLGAILEAWKKLGAARSEALMITAGNADKARLNAGARDILRIEGKLAGESAVAQLGRVFSSAADRSDVRSYKVGDLVRFGWSLKGKGIGRGEYLRVTGIDRAHGVPAARTPRCW